MEFNGHGFLEELLSLRRENTWETFHTGMDDEFIADAWNFNCFNTSPDWVLPNYSFRGVAASTIEDGHGFGFGVGDELSTIELDPLQKKCATPVPFHQLVQEEDHHPLMVDDEEHCPLSTNDLQNLEEKQTTCKVEQVLQDAETPAFDMGLCLERRNRVKKIDGKPSKNLMAERRRRKRLNDRLAMLRSVVPKISKMDRTSILGDTIDYMKELLGRIKNFEEEIDAGSDSLNLMGIFKELKPNEILIRNTPKFDVERRIKDTRIEVCCTGKPGLLLSTITTLEALGLDIQQCVISCFSDFAMRASCSEELEKRSSVRTEEIKEALFRNAGYGGRCL